VIAQPRRLPRKSEDLGEPRRRLRAYLCQTCAKKALHMSMEVLWPGKNRSRRRSSLYEEGHGGSQRGREKSLQIATNNSTSTPQWPCVMHMILLHSIDPHALISILSAIICGCDNQRGGMYWRPPPGIRQLPGQLGQLGIHAVCESNVLDNSKPLPAEVPSQHRSNNIPSLYSLTTRIVSTACEDLRNSMPISIV
jgi:hypothetical protein